MRFLENMNVGKKIICLSLALLLFMTIITIFSIRSLNTIKTELNLLYEVDLPALSSAKEVNILFLSASRAMRNMNLFLNQNDLETVARYRDRYNGYMQDLWAEFDGIGPNIVTDAGKQVFTRASESLKKVEAMQRGTIERVKTGLQFNAMLKELVDTRPSEDQAEALLAELVTVMDEEARLRAVGANHLYRQTLYISLAISLVALFASVFLGVMIKRAIANPLVSVAGKAAKVADGDLGQEFKFHRSDEIGALATALERMVANLRQRIGEAEQKSHEAEEQSQKAMEAMSEAQKAKEAAEDGQKIILTAAEDVEVVVSRLSTASEELSSQVVESSHSMDIQRDRLASSATAMEEMNSTVLEVARNAGVASEGSERARNKASDGEEIVRQSIQSISDVQSDMVDLRVNMEELGKQAESIGTVMTVISDIADQTNLLALNAAIEAARAGEAGRGFAVVADEVRKLAEKTMTATKEVGSAILGIQNSTSQSIKSVERTTDNLDSASNLVTKSGEALSQIVEESIQTADQVRNIATAAEQQSASSEEITSALDEISNMSNETATALQHSAQAVSELASQTQELQELVNKLRTV